MTKKIKMTELVLRDAHQSLFATRLRLDDMLPIAHELDDIGYWSLEAWAVQHLIAVFASWVKIRGFVCVN